MNRGLARILLVDRQKCDGCGECAQACQQAQRRPSGTSLALVAVISFPGEGNWCPMVCQQCEDPPCAGTCPTGALARDGKESVVGLDRDRCAACGMCLISCPFGAIQLDFEVLKAVKCDLCGGNPECAKVCKAGALAWSGPQAIGRARRQGVGAAIGRAIEGWH